MSENADIFRINTSDGREIILIGTAHISQASKELVRETIEAEKPDTICIELDEGRLTSGKLSRKSSSPPLSRTSSSGLTRRGWATRLA